MSGERFYVIQVAGFGGASGARAGVSYSVLDSAYCHREVYRAYVTDGRAGNRASDRLARCERVAAQRNALDAGGCAA